jgi:hypothetical protein
MYRKDDPYEVILNKQLDSVVRGTIVVNILPPIRLSTIIGDCVTNARAALDYVIFQLARKYFVPPYDPATDKNLRSAVTFPIYVPGEHGYQVGLDRLANLLKPAGTRDIPTLVVDRIKAAQTHQDRNDTLGWLHAPFVVVTSAERVKIR